MRHGKPNHTCRICGKKYFACDTCDEKIGKTWRAVACTAEHYDIYYALWRYNYGEITEDEIKKILTDAKANTWKDSPSRDIIIKLIGEPEEESEETPEENHEEVMPNLVYVKDDSVKTEPVHDEHVKVEPVRAEKPAVINTKYNNYNGKSRHKVGGKYAYRNNNKETSRR